MEKKQFFASFIVDPHSEVGHTLQGFQIIDGVLASARELVWDPKTQELIEPLMHEVLLRAWMFDAVFNGDWNHSIKSQDPDVPLWPLVAIYLFGEPFFINRSYCYASGLSPAEVLSYVRTDHLYEEVYSTWDAKRAREWVQRLRAGKWYRDLGLSMKHIHRTTFWNSYGGWAEEMEVRIGRDITMDEDLHEDYYQGNSMNSVSILETLYTHLSREATIPSVLRAKIFWITEYLSLFDFFWNHGGFALECVFVSPGSNGAEEVLGHYNSVYARLLEQSFQWSETFRKIFPSVYGSLYQGGRAWEWLARIDTLGWTQIHRRKHRHPAAQMFWRHLPCTYDGFPEHPILGVGIARAIRSNREGWWKRFLGNKKKED